MPRRNVRRPPGRPPGARDPWRAPRLVHTGRRHGHPARALAPHRPGSRSVSPSHPGATPRRPATPRRSRAPAVLRRSPGRAPDRRHRSGRGTTGRAHGAERQARARGNQGSDCAPARRRAGRGSHPEESSATSVPTAPGSWVQRGCGRPTRAARSPFGGDPPPDGRHRSRGHVPRGTSLELAGGARPGALIQERTARAMFHVEHRTPGTRNGRPGGRPFRTTGSVQLDPWTRWSVSPSAAPLAVGDPRPPRRNGRRPAPRRRRAPACGRPRT